MELTFGEQIKVILKRKNMTIRMLAERIEEQTGKPMSRQNLTQKLGRDNFQEQDMREIARALGCRVEISVIDLGEEAAPAGKPLPAKREHAAHTTESAAKKPESISPPPVFEGTDIPHLDDDVIVPLEPEAREAYSPMREEPEPGPEPAVQPEEAPAQTESAPLQEEPSEKEAELFRSIEQALMESLVTEFAAQEETEAAGEEPEDVPYDNESGGDISYASKPYVISREDQSAAEKSGVDISSRIASWNAAARQRLSGPGKKLPAHTEDSREAASAEGEVFPSIDPSTGKEYESNMVRHDPEDPDMLYVYDADEHKWIRQARSAFVDFQIRKRAVLGMDYEPPVYID